MKIEHMKLLFRTDPHNAQGVYDADEDSGLPTHNKLHCVEDDQGRYINMTGEELTSLANQWLEYAKTQGTANTKVSHAHPKTSNDGA
jgi:hypothetical protein